MADTNEGRKVITDDMVKATLTDVIGGTYDRFDRHGQFAHFSRHESHGIIVEEVDEMYEAVRSKIDDEYYTEVMDVIVAGIWTLASRKAREQDTSPIIGGKVVENRIGDSVQG